jgi:hypothetical protein
VNIVSRRIQVMLHSRFVADQLRITEVAPFLGFALDRRFALCETIASHAAARFSAMYLRLCSRKHFRQAVPVPDRTILMLPAMRS